ncbi:hypothetical protein HMI55_000086 [Coelomomyces lativittatus]|nr:hypothetical protein HMI56_006397 [Coelomomyces lativittatus]KAJ1517311.1 hypothetical protein HMI55_000086 [Coelomomyces lativittatus]
MTSPKLEFEFTFRNEDNTLLQIYGRNQPARIFIEDETRLNREDILLSSSLEGKQIGHLSVRHFSDIKNCKDLHQKVLILGIFYRGKEGTRIQGKLRVRYHVPFYLYV